MRPLLLSGLLCVPALAMLTFGWPQDRPMHMGDAPAAPAAVAVAIERPVITVSLPPTKPEAEPLQTNVDAWPVVWTGSLTAAATPPQTSFDAWQFASSSSLEGSPTHQDRPPPHRKPFRVLHARAALPHPASPVAQTTPQERPATVLIRVVQWLTRHEAPRVWSSGGGEGAG